MEVRDSEVHLHDISNPKEPELLARITSHSCVVCSVHQQGDILATGSKDNYVHLHDISNPRMPELITKIKEDYILSVHQQGSILAIGSANSDIHLYKITGTD